jgi:hypothetical protein
MTENEARAILYDAFRDTWPSSFPTVPYTLDNEQFISDGVAEWVSMVVRHGVAGQETLGAIGDRVYQRRGLVIVQLFVAVDRGLLRLDELGRAARDIFEGKTLSQVRCYNGQYRELGKEGQWMRGNVSVAFSYDEHK